VITKLLLCLIAMFSFIGTNNSFIHPHFHENEVHTHREEKQLDSDSFSQLTDSTITMSLLSENPNLASDTYKEKYKVTPKSVSASDGSDPSCAFDDDASSQWSAYSTGEVYIQVDFKELTSISKFIYKSTQPGGGAEGYPKTLKIYASNDNNTYTQVGIYQETSGVELAQNTHQRVVFNLRSAIEVTSIKISFDNAQYDNKARCADMVILKTDELLNSVETLFTDLDRTLLRDDVDADTILSLKNQVNNSGSEIQDYMLELLERASNVLNGQRTDYPVEVLHKSGHDSQKINLLFVGDRYTSSEQDSFINTAKTAKDYLFNFEPYKTYKDYFNIYAMKVPSGDEGYFESSNEGRTISLTQTGRERLRELRRQMKLYYLDGGGEIKDNCSVIFVNSGTYGGSMLYPDAATLFLGQAWRNVFIHELSHGLAILRDEYVDKYGGYNEGPNISGFNTEDTVPWSAYCGYKGIGIVKMGSTGWYKSTSSCIMDSVFSMYSFCEVCKKNLIRGFNTLLGDDSIPYYIAEPEIQFYNSAGNKLTDVYVANGNTNTLSSSYFSNLEGGSITIRSVIENYSSTTRTFNVEFSLYDSSSDTVVARLNPSVQYIVLAGKTQKVDPTITNINGLTNYSSNLTIKVNITQTEVEKPNNYSIVINSVSNGSVNSNVSSAKYGENVTLTLNPDTNYTLDTISIKDSSNNEISFTKVNENTYTFVMPASPVSISVSYKEMKECNHTGGIATCTSKAICERCGKEYGEPLGHAYDDPIFTWTGFTSAKATFICSRDSSHIQEYEAIITNEVTTEPTHDNDGIRTYTAKVTFNEKTYTDTKTSSISKLGHTFSETTYVWNDDNTSITATRTCLNEENHVENLTGIVTKVRKEATCTGEGLITYTATFDKDWAESQTKEEKIPANGHSFNSTYECIEEGHYQMCENCDEVTTIEPHVYDDEYDYYCKICGYKRKISDEKTNEEKAGLSKGAVAGIVAVSVGGVSIIGACLYFFIKKKIL